jgi:hypothetical protein
MVRSFLNDHPDTLTFFELFHVDRSGIPFDVDGFRSKGKTEEVVNLRNTNPVKFLKEEVFQVYPSHLNAVGFKLLYTQARYRKMWWDTPRYSDWWEHMDGSRKAWRNAKSDLWSYLHSHTDLKVIHLVRENLLRQKLSARLAKATGKWGVGATGGIAKPREKPRVTLDPERCKRDFAAKERMRREAVQNFSDHDLLQTSYERISDTPQAVLARIQRFLDLDVMTLHTDTRKQEKRPLEEAIANYSELRDALSDTPWHRFFGG